MVEYDMDTAKAMFETGRYVYVIFMCHLAIEKSLKSVICEKFEVFPPKTHDLIYLLGAAKIDLTVTLLDFIGMINNASVVTRYPEDLDKLVAVYPRDTAQKYWQNTKEVVECIRRELK